MVGGDTFSPLAPVLGPEPKKLAMSLPSTVHGSQYDTKYQVCDIRVDGATGGRDFPSFNLDQLVCTFSETMALS